MNQPDREALVGYRLEQARQALADAGCLQGHDGSPVSITNRSYYAMFYAVLALLQTIQQVPRKHAGAIALFDREFVAKGLLPREFSKSFHRAFEVRQRGDYLEFHDVNAEEAAEILAAAREFVRAVSDYLKQEH